MITFPAPTFAIWCVVVVLRIREQTGRTLADAPYSQAVLWCWYDHGVPARVVWNAVAWRMSQVARVTFSRFHTDRRVKEVKAELAFRYRTGTGRIGDGTAGSSAL